MDFFETLSVKRGDVELKKVKAIKPATLTKRKTPLSKLGKLSQNLIPDNPNVGVKRTRTASTKKVDPKESPKTIVERNTGASNPFRNGVEFWKFYKATLQIKVGDKIPFDSNVSAEARYAAEVLDMLIDSKKEDVAFLVSWIDFFYRTKLKGKRTITQKNTSLASFIGTFEEFMRRVA